MIAARRCLIALALVAVAALSPRAAVAQGVPNLPTGGNSTRVAPPSGREPAQAEPFSKASLLLRWRSQMFQVVAWSAARTPVGEGKLASYSRRRSAR